jgi:methyl-accepting chemotaxis protein
MNIMKLNIGQRLTLGFGIVIALLGLLATLATLRISGLADQVNQVVNDRYPKTVTANKIKTDLNEISRSMLSTLVMTDASQIKAELKNIEEKNLSSNQAFDKLEKEAHSETGAALLKEIKTSRERFAKVQADFVKLINEERKDDAMVQFNFKRAVLVKYFVVLDKFIEFQHKQMDQAGQDSATTAEQTKWLILFLAVIAGVLSVLVAYTSTHSITVPIKVAVKIAKRVADGDLTHKIQARSTDETGQMIDALQHMNDSLLEIVTRVRQGTDSIASASAEIASGNLDLSSRTEHQADSLGQTAASMRDLTNTVRQNAENASQADKLASRSSEVALRGGGVVSNVIETMGSITESSKKIVDIIAVIDGIAFQTNILALNAAVEAARAGEQGRGFAVVASEVRNLAQRSASAAKEIKHLINDSVSKVKEGSNLVEQAGVTMEEVVASIRLVTNIMGEITSASQEQSAGIEQVNHSISEMDETTQQNAALVEEAAAAAQSMQDQAANLAQVVSIFRTPDYPHGRSVPAHPTATAPKASAPPAPRALAKVAPTPARKPQSAASSDGWEEF